MDRMGIGTVMSLFLVPFYFDVSSLKLSESDVDK